MCRLVSLMVTILALALGTIGCVSLKIEPLERNESASNISTVRLTIPVKIKENGAVTYKIIATLSYSGDLEGKPLQVLLSGGGYGPVYFDFPYQPETYSYVLAAVKAGHAALNLSRIGIGGSSRPPGNQVDTDANAYVVHQVIKALVENKIMAVQFGPVITVGHSMGSVMAIAHAVAYPEDIDGVILTGILHNTNPEYTERVRDGSKSAIFDPRFAFKIWDFTYFTSKPGMREEMFYHVPGSDPNIIPLDEATRETLTLGEIISIARFDRRKTMDIQVPVLLVNGDRDFTSCGGDLDCSNYNEIFEYEKQFFSEAAELEVYLPSRTGHVINLHRTAPGTYRVMLDWFDRKITG